MDTNAKALAIAYAKTVPHDIHIPTCARIIEIAGHTTLQEVKEHFERDEHSITKESPLPRRKTLHLGSPGR